MKTDSKQRAILVVQVIGWFLLICIVYMFMILAKNIIFENTAAAKISNSKDEIAVVKIENLELDIEKTLEEAPEAAERDIVYDNMTIEELSAKLDRSLNSTLAGTGYQFATISLELGVDPYLAVAIVLEETGCKWNCSNLVKQCNNVGGQKGGTVKCNGGSYRYYPTLEEGIYGFIDNLARNYYALGLTTPEQMNPKYAASTKWSSKVNNYIATIKEN